MHRDKFVFAQLVEFLNNNKFRRLVEKYSGDYHKSFKQKERPTNSYKY